MVTAIDHAAIFIAKETKNSKFLEASKAVMYSSGDEMKRDTLKMDTMMLRIYKKLRKIIADELGVEESEVNLNAAFTNDLGADSLDTVELVMAWEKEFMISIPDEDCGKITTVGKAVSYINTVLKNNKQAKKSS